MTLYTNKSSGHDISFFVFQNVDTKLHFHMHLCFGGPSAHYYWWVISFRYFQWILCNVLLYSHVCCPFAIDTGIDKRSGDCEVFPQGKNKQKKQEEDEQQQ